MSKYEGWKNYQTWNVMPHINNTENLYFAARDFMTRYKGRKPYSDFIRHMGMEHDRTPIDRIKWISTRLSYEELNAAMKELAA